MTQTTPYQPFPNSFKQKLLAGERLIGCWSSLANAITTEVLGVAGFDWILLDGEHSPNDVNTFIPQLMALKDSSSAPVVRPTSNNAVELKRLLDAGFYNFLIPFVESEAEALAAVRATRYPPQGVRGMAGMGRASRFGTTPDYFRSANGNVCAVLQLETRGSVARLEEIAAVPGVDALFVGPGDLSGTMGHVGQLTHPDVMALMADAARRAHALGMPIGTVGGNPETVAQYRAMGYDFVAVASDLGLLMRAAQAAAQALRAMDAPPAASAVPPVAQPRAEGY